MDYLKENVQITGSSIDSELEDGELFENQEKNLEEVIKEEADSDKTTMKQYLKVYEKHGQ